MTELVRVRDTGNTHEARYKGKKSTCTGSPLQAAICVVQKTRTDNRWYVERVQPAEAKALEDRGELRRVRFCNCLKAWQKPIYFEVIEK